MDFLHNIELTDPELYLIRIALVDMVQQCEGAGESSSPDIIKAGKDARALQDKLQIVQNNHEDTTGGIVLP